MFYVPGIYNFLVYTIDVGERDWKRKYVTSIKTRLMMANLFPRVTEIIANLGFYELSLVFCQVLQYPVQLCLYR